MDMEKARQLLTVAKFLALMPKSGGGWDTATSFVKWGGCSYSTTYRYLPKLEKLGYVESREVKIRKMRCKEYRITGAGLAYLCNFNEIPF